MAIVVTHTKVSTIPDGDDTSLIRPSDWNETHTLTGLGTMAEQNANAVAITGGTISGVTLPASNITGTLGVPNGGTGATTLTGYVKGTGVTAMTASATIPNTDITGLGTASTKDAGVANGVATLDGSGTVPISQLPAAVLGALSYQGTWNASTNTPTLTSSVGTKGYYYVVSVAGSTNLNGITDWQVGDWAVYNGTAWQKIDNTDAVTSVNGYTGTVVLTTTNIAEGTNEYFTTAKARASVSAGTGISYNSTTGVITNSSPSLGGDVVGPSSATDNAVARFDTTTGKLIQNSVTLIDDTGNASGILSQQFSNGSAVTVAAGKMWYDGSTGAWNAGMGGGNITQQIGEELFVYGKASAAITDSPLQIIYQTGTVGASGVITFAPTVAGITDGFAIIGVATESLALNAFGRATSYGVVRGITTNGTAFGETWADGDEIWYNPVTGNPTNVKPVAPNIKVSVGTIIKAGSGGSGSIQVEIAHGSVLGGTDSNVQLNGVTNGQIISYDGGNGYWKNTDLTAGTAISVAKSANGVLTVNNTGVTSAVAGTGISVSGATGAVTVTNTAPDQTVVLTAGTGISTSGTYPNFTITNTSPSLGGTVTSVAQSFTGGLISVAGSPITTSGTLALTVAGTSGGIPYFSSATTWATSAALAANALMIGGGAGVAPSTVTTGTGVVTALGVNTGSAGAFVVNGGALGTPSSGTVTNLTGTASININGTVGATTANTGAFTTLSASSTVSGTGFSTYLASPPAIGGTVAAAITGTTITATKFVGVSGGTF
jgi:hypothetical protein